MAGKSSSRPGGNNGNDSNGAGVAGASTNSIARPGTPDDLVAGDPKASDPHRSAGPYGVHPPCDGGEQR